MGEDVRIAVLATGEDGSLHLSLGCFVVTQLHCAERIDPLDISESPRTSITSHAFIVGEWRGYDEFPLGFTVPISCTPTYGICE